MEILRFGKLISEPPISMWTLKKRKYCQYGLWRGPDHQTTYTSGRCLWGSHRGRENRSCSSLEILKGIEPYTAATVNLKPNFTAPTHSIGLFYLFLSPFIFLFDNGQRLTALSLKYQNLFALSNLLFCISRNKDEKMLIEENKKLKFQISECEKKILPPRNLHVLRLLFHLWELIAFGIDSIFIQK